MKNIDLNNIKDLLKLKESFSNTLNKRIEKLELNEKLSNIDTANFGSLKQIFESISHDLFNTKEGRALIKEFVTVIRKNVSLKEAYQLYKQLSKLPKTVDNSSLITLLENVVKNIDIKKFNIGEKKIRSVIKEGVKLSSLTANDIDNILLKNKELNESYEFIITNPINSKNIAKTYDSVNNICKIINERTDTIVEKQPLNVVNKSTKEICEDLNTLMREGVEEWERNVIMDITLGTISGKDKQTLFEEYKKTCISSINELINNSNLSDKANLELMKEQINNKKYKETTFNDDMFKLSELNHTIKTQE